MSQMKNSLINLSKALEDISMLLGLSHTVVGREHTNNILRSTVVLMAASWEQYIEQLAENSVTTLAERLRSSDPIPEGVKQSIAIYLITDNRSNKKEFSDSVWQFADKGWKSAYIQFCKFSTARISSASSENISRLCQNILGIRDVTSSWSFKSLTAKECCDKLDDLVSMRHDVAHGANTRSDELTDDYVRNLVEFITEIAAQTYEAVNNHTVSLSCEEALTYSFTMSCYPDIVSLGAKKEDGVLTLKDFKSLGSSAQGNHNKLKYEPWGLLETIDGKSRRVTDRLIKFYKGEIKLPLNILVFDNGDAIPTPDTSYISFSEMQPGQGDEGDES